MLFTFLLIIHTIIAALLVGVILMQRSEGGGLTSGGSPSGLMSARGAADFLTRATGILAALFIAMSILLSVIAAGGSSRNVDTSLSQQPGTLQAPAAPQGGAAPAAVPETGPSPQPEASPTAAGGNNALDIPFQH